MHKFLKQILVFLALSNLPLFTLAQISGTVSGKVNNQVSNKPIEFVNIVLMKPGFDTPVKREVTNDKGIYILKNVPEGTYYVIASFIGYQNFKSKPITINNLNKKIILDVTLDGGAQNLDEVSVVSNKPLYSNSIDRKVYQVSQDILAKSGSASEVLSNVPLVQVDIDGNVSLRNATAMILIDGKVSPLMGANAAAALQQLPANSIEKIEVITNPSAKYNPTEPEGL